MEKHAFHNVQKLTLYKRILIINVHYRQIVISLMVSLLFKVLINNTTYVYHNVKMMNIYQKEFIVSLNVMLINILLIVLLNNVYQNVKK